MKAISLLAVLLLSCSAARSQGAGEDCRPYMINLVQAALDTASSNPGFVSSHIQRGLQMQGDAVAIVLLKVLESRDFTDPQKVRAIIQIIRQSFTAVQAISIAEDKRPKVTVFLLNYVRQNVKDAKLAIEVQQAIDFVMAQTSATKGNSP